MHVYTIGYKSADGTKVIEVTHDWLMNRDQVEALVRDVLPDAARLHMAALAEKERKRGQVPDDLFDVCFIPRVNFNHVYKHVVDLLIERHGFRKLEYAASLTVFSIPDLLVRGDAAGDPDGDEALQERLSDAMAQAGLPVVTMEQRDAQEEAKIEALAPIRRVRRAERAVARFRSSGHNPFRTEDPRLVQEVLSQLAGRPLDEAEASALTELLPPLLETEEHPEPGDLGLAFLSRPELHALALLLGVEPPQPEPESEPEPEPEPEPVPGADEVLSVGESAKADIAVEVEAESGAEATEPQQAQTE